MLGLFRKDGQQVTLMVPPGFSGPIVVQVKRHFFGTRVGIEAPKEVKIYRTEKMQEWGIEPQPKN